MVVDNLLLTAAGLATGMLMVLLYYAMLIEPIVQSDFTGEELEHQPTLDDDIVYFTYSTYPYQEPIRYSMVGANRKNT